MARQPPDEVAGEQGPALGGHLPGPAVEVRGDRARPVGGRWRAAHRRSRPARRRCRRWPARVPVPLTNAVPSAPATTVASPLSSTAQPRSAARRRAAPTRSAPTSDPNRANSRSCGVSRVARAAPDQGRLRGQHRQRVGVDHHGLGRWRAPPPARCGRRRRCPCRTDHPRLHPPGVPWSAVGDDRLGQAAGRRPPPCPAYRTRPGRSAARRPGAEDAGPGVGRRAGDDADDTLRVLVVVGRAAAAAAAASASVSRNAVGAAGADPGRCRPGAPLPRGPPRADDQAELDRTEGHRAHAPRTRAPPPRRCRRRHRWGRRPRP